jgi:hypothetical protein
MRVTFDIGVFRGAKPLVKLLLIECLWACLTLFTAQSAEGTSPPLKVIIEIPQMCNWQTGQPLFIPQLSDIPKSPILDSESHFHVLVKNISSKPVYIFNEDNSEGCRALSLEITEADGTKIVLCNQPISWTTNMIATERLDPGECQIREIYYATNSSNGHRWSAFPPPANSEITLRAIFEQIRPKWAVSNTLIWWGKVESAPRKIVWQHA